MVSGKCQCAPSDVDYDLSRLEAVNRHLQRLIDSNDLQAASYCLTRDGKVFADNALGKLSFRKDDPREMRPDSIQWIASITKLFTAAAVFKLVEDGLLRPTQAVGEILPEMNVPPFNGITIAMLLSHTSGLNPDGGCFENKYYKNPWDLIALMNGTNWLEAGLSVGMRSKPGTEWAYCSFGFAILGEVVTRASGMDVHDFIEREFFDPCGMADTAFHWRLLAKEGCRDRALGTRGLGLHHGELRCRLARVAPAAGLGLRRRQIGARLLQPQREIARVEHDKRVTQLHLLVVLHQDAAHEGLHLGRDGRDVTIDLCVVAGNHVPAREPGSYAPGRSGGSDHQDDHESHPRGARRRGPGDGRTGSRGGGRDISQHVSHGRARGASTVTSQTVRGHDDAERAV